MEAPFPQKKKGRKFYQRVIWDIKVCNSTDRKLLIPGYGLRAIIDYSLKQVASRIAFKPNRLTKFETTFMTLQFFEKAGGRFRLFPVFVRSRDFDRIPTRLLRSRWCSNTRLLVEFS